MKTRRDFLAALGFGAGASVMGLPGMAQAWGGRLRRARGCVSECESASECSCAIHVNPYATVMSCGCACPLALYAHTADIWYYYCKCCSGGPNVFAPSTRQYTTFPTCPSSDCIGSGCGSLSPDYKRGSAMQNVYERFLLDPNATFKVGSVEKNHLAPFIDGIDAKDAKEIVVHSDDATVGSPIRAKYDDGFANKTRYVVLFNLTYSVLAPMLIGFEVKQDTGSWSTADTFSAPDGRLRRCHFVQFGGQKYLVALIK
jgi:hypothetical protein